MKSTINIWTVAVMFVGTFGLIGAYAAPTPETMHKRSVSITGCLEEGTGGNEYNLLTNDGSTWGISASDFNLKNYVGRTVTVAGDVVHSSAKLKTVANDQDTAAAQHHIKVMDLAVDSETCQK